jgi:hypothetical protein
MYLDQAKTPFATLHIAAHEISQCTETEVAQLEQQLGHAIPAAYCEFLLWMGHGAGNFLRGSDVFYEHLRSNVSAARELLRENNISLDLPVDALVSILIKATSLPTSNCRQVITHLFTIMVKAKESRKSESFIPA